MAQGKNRFSALRALREQRHDQDVEEDARLDLGLDKNGEAFQGDEGHLSASKALAKDEKKKSLRKTKGQGVVSEETKGKPGRPPGRRSNPDYTQISAYIPLELLQEVQDELAEERRVLKQRTARPVSDLVEELLGHWLAKRKRKT